MGVVLSGSWGRVCFVSSTFVGVAVVGWALFEQPLTANNRIRNMPAIFVFHKVRKKFTPFFELSTKQLY